MATKRDAAVESPWLTLDEAAAYARMNRALMSRLLNAGDVVGFRRTPRSPWIVNRDAVDAYLTDQPYTTRRGR